VATSSRLLKIIGLFCRILSLLYVSFVKETCNFKEPTNGSHPILPYSLTHAPTHFCTRRLSHTHTTHTCTNPHTLAHSHVRANSVARVLSIGWRRLIGSPKLQIIFHKRAIKYRSLLLKMTCKDQGSYESWPPSIAHELSRSQALAPASVLAVKLSFLLSPSLSRTPTPTSTLSLAHTHKLTHNHRMNYADLPRRTARATGAAK